MVQVLWERGLIDVSSLEHYILEGVKNPTIHAVWYFLTLVASSLVGPFHGTTCSSIVALLLDSSIGIVSLAGYNILPASSGGNMITEKGRDHSDLESKQSMIVTER